MNLAVSKDYLYNFTPIATWSFIEIGVGMIACNLMTLRPLVTRLFSPGGIPAADNNDHPPTIGRAKRRVPGWLSGHYPTWHSRHAGAIELNDVSTGSVHAAFELGHMQRTQSESNAGESESMRVILRDNSVAMGDFRIRREVEAHQTSAV
ncbi:hypothetical protein B0J12DRAFT_733960 [Macrophomina phaseolina]|uniref:Uncharacterized protein n=1 Tax=Macrophomina phaseolina TaxID=35725 RepID=A0ABQ8FP58_9PEZI|nr:hypothetical protein B0J12DRAFT_733960 [Macrophomina phaseolina]